MQNEKEKSNKLNKSHYLSKKYINSKIRKLVITSYYTKDIFSRNKESRKNNFYKLSKSNFYYKDPKFFNDNNLNLQLSYLRDLCDKNDTESLNKKKSFDYSLKDTSSRNFNESIKKVNTFSNKNDNPKLPILKRNNTVDFDIKINDTKSKYTKLLLNKKSDFFDNKFKTEENQSEDLSRNSSEIINEKVYKLIFKSFQNNNNNKSKIIENKLNIKYAENEEQYKMIIEKEYKDKIKKGKKIKLKNVCPSIKLKLDEAQEKIKFMKDVIDYSYPLCVLSKIKVKQKELKEMKKQRYEKYLDSMDEKERRLKEVEIRNDNRTKYLLKSISFLKSK